MWQTDGDDYLQVEVTSIRLFLLCIKLTKLVDFYDVTGVVAQLKVAIRDTNLLEHTVHSVHFSRFAARWFKRVSLVIFWGPDPLLRRSRPNCNTIWMRSPNCICGRRTVLSTCLCVTVWRDRLSKGSGPQNYYPKWPTSVFVVYCGAAELLWRFLSTALYAHSCC